MSLGKSETLWLHPKWMSSDEIREADKVRSMSVVALWCYNRTQTSFAQPTVFCYLFIIKARNFPIFCQFANLTFVRGLTSYFISVGNYLGRKSSTLIVLRLIYPILEQCFLLCMQGHVILKSVKNLSCP